MSAPTRLEDWTIESLRQLLDEGASETTFEFKGTLGSLPTIDVMKAMCSFANADGGFVLFGVQNAGSAADRLAGIPATPENPRTLSQKVQRVWPSLSYRTAPIPLPNGNEVLVAEVTRGERPHGFVDGDRWAFWRRGEATALVMQYPEIEVRFVNQAERVARVHVVYLTLAMNWQRLINILEAALRADSAISLTVPDLSLVRQYLGDVSYLCPDAVRPLLRVLEHTDLIEVHLQSERDLMNSALMGKEKSIDWHNASLVSQIQAIRPHLEEAMVLMQARLGFAGVPVGSGTLPPLVLPTRPAG